MSLNIDVSVLGYEARRAEEHRRWLEKERCRRARHGAQRDAATGLSVPVMKQRDRRQLLLFPEET